MAERSLWDILRKPNGPKKPSEPKKLAEPPSLFSTLRLPKIPVRPRVPLVPVDIKATPRTVQLDQLTDLRSKREIELTKLKRTYLLFVGRLKEIEPLLQYVIWLNRALRALLFGQCAGKPRPVPSMTLRTSTTVLIPSANASQPLVESLATLLSPAYRPSDAPSLLGILEPPQSTWEQISHQSMAPPEQREPNLQKSVRRAQELYALLYERFYIKLRDNALCMDRLGTAGCGALLQEIQEQQQSNLRLAKEASTKARQDTLHLVQVLTEPNGKQVK
jgi:hypothetical protein